MAHICYLTGLYSRRDSLMFYRQGAGMVSAGHKVSMIVCDDKENEVINGIHIYSTQFKPKNRLERFIKTKNIVLKLADKIDADIYQISDPEHISMVSHFKKKGKSVIFNMREYYPNMLMSKSYIPISLRKMVSNLYKKMMRRYFPKYGAIFTVTPSITNILKEEFGLRNVYTLSNFPIPNENYSLSKEDYMSRKDVAIYVGTVYTASRQNIFLDALQQNPQVHYLIAGRFYEGYDKIQNHPLWGKVEFINGFKREEMASFFARATFSNTLRDFGGRDGSLGVIKIFESMEAALPVIFSDVPSYRNIVEKYHCGVCANPNDVESVEKAIRYLVENKEEAYEMGQNGRRAVLEEYNWWTQFKIYQEVILNIIK